MTTTTKLASAALWLFGAVVVAYGLSGILLPGLWLHHPLLLSLAPLGEGRGTFLFEFRFLHGRELGVGLFALLLHDEILNSRRANLAFVAALFAAPLGRAYSCLADGPPRPLWLAFLAVEASMALLIFATTAEARRRAPRPEGGR